MHAMSLYELAGFVIAGAIGIAVILYVARGRSIQRETYPWLLDEVSKLHVMIVGTLAGFAFTGVILVVTFAHDRPGGNGAALDTVILMFLVSYLYWVGAAFLISYVPHREAGADLVQRVHFSLATTIEYRTVFLSWFALLPLLQANGLGDLVHVLDVLLAASLVIGSALVAVATDGLGVVRVSEVYLSAGIATLLALGYALLVAFGFPAARTPTSTLLLVVVIFCLNGAGFIGAAATSTATRYPAVSRFYDKRGRQIVVCDMQLTMLSLAFLWLAVAGVI